MIEVAKCCRALIDKHPLPGYHGHKPTMTCECGQMWYTCNECNGTDCVSWVPGEPGPCICESGWIMGMKKEKKPKKAAVKSKKDTSDFFDKLAKKCEEDDEPNYFSKLDRKPDWYDGIEPGVREVVRLLRNNGFNTTCSCEHDMTIEVDLGNNLDEAERLANVLIDNDHKEFKIEAELQAPKDGFWTRRATLVLKKWH